MSSSERKEFEDWCLTQGWNSGHLHRSKVNGKYAWRALNDNWATWQAARRAQASAEPYDQPLYAAPQRAPLTREQVREVVEDAGFACPKATYAEQAAFISGLRHGEVAHGITAAKAAIAAGTNGEAS